MPYFGDDVLKFTGLARGVCPIQALTSFELEFSGMCLRQGSPKGSNHAVR